MQFAIVIIKIKLFEREAKLTAMTIKLVSDNKFKQTQHSLISGLYPR